MIRNNKTTIIVDKDGLMSLYRDFMKRGFCDRIKLDYINEKYGKFEYWQRDFLEKETLDILNTKILAGNTEWRANKMILIDCLGKTTAKERRKQFLRESEGKGFQFGNKS
jgi:hypothetical protein